MPTQDLQLTKVIIEMFINAHICLVGDYSNSKLKAKQYKQDASPKRHKTRMKIWANRWLIGAMRF